MHCRGNGSVVAVTRPYHGLGNRMRVVFGAKALAAMTERDFAYVWPVGPAFGARLTDLWMVQEKRLPPWRSKLLSTRHPYRDEKLAWMDGAGSDLVWQIRTAHELLLPERPREWEEQLHRVQPVPAIQVAVQEFHQRHLDGSAWVGVMVRAHPVSHRETLEASPIEWYVERMKQLREAHPEMRFFVSADTPEAAETVTAAVPGCVTIRNKGPYNSLEGLQAAVTDLYLLAGSCYLLGPHYSSFPELAQRLAGPGLTLETSRTAASQDLSQLDVTIAADPVRPQQRRPVKV